MVKKVFLLLTVFLGLFLIPKSVYAASLTQAKDIISTSRPSAAAPLATNVAINDSLFYFEDNGSKFLASDSAKFYPDTGETLETVIVASQSASAGSTAPVQLATRPAATHHKGSVIMVPVTAKHTISFTTTTAIPSNGIIQVIFPAGNTTNAASPSASGFSFNGLSNSDTSNLQISGATCGSWTVTAATGLVQCNLNAGVGATTPVSISIGTSNPTLINPTKSAVGGTADYWGVTVKTLDGSSTEIDSSKLKIGTVESVNVYAVVEPTFTFSIKGINNGIAINTGNATGCPNTETTNTGFNSSPIEVNMGVLGSGVVNIAAQLITITTNGSSGYSLLATSSGHLIDSSIGYWIADAQGTPTSNDIPVPSTIAAGVPGFGIHPCGLNVSNATWVQGGASQTCTTGSGTNCYYANPSARYYYTLASATSGPIGNAITAGSGLTTIEYAAAMSVAVPAGNYKTIMTYVATPIF